MRRVGAIVSALATALLLLFIRPAEGLDVWSSVPMIYDGHFACTAWVLSSKLLVTNAHCARKLGEYKAVAFSGHGLWGATVVFTEWMDACAKELDDGEQAADCHLRADVAFLSLNRPAPGTLSPAALDPEPGTNVIIPNHAGMCHECVGQGTVIGYGDIHTGESLMLLESHLGKGSSGSPVIDTHTGRVVGMLTRITKDLSHNAAVPITEIMQELRRATR